MCTMMTQTILHDKSKTGLWTKFAATMTKLENITVKPHEEKCAYEKFYGKIPDKKHLKTFE